jgi:hypothetical protein
LRFGVDAVLVVAVDAVVVVVAQRLAPEAVVRRLGAVVAHVLRGAGAAGEREVVAVHVHDRLEPQLFLLEERLDLRIVLVLGEPHREPAAFLGGQPLARMIEAREQQRRARTVGDVARVRRSS